MEVGAGGHSLHRSIELGLRMISTTLDDACEWFGTFDISHSFVELIAPN